MEPIRFLIPKRTSDSFGDPINYMFKYIEQTNLSDSKVYVFDFDSCRFTSPFLIGGLTSIANSNLENGGSNTWLYNKNDEYLAGYLNAIKFPEGIDFQNTNPNQLDELFKPYYDKTYIPIICFPTGLIHAEIIMREKVLTAVNTLLKNQLNLKGQILTGISYMIDEMTQNIVDHSDSEKGIIFAQFYPTKNYLDLCIADYGKGLYKSYQESDKHNPKNTEEAINFAVFGKSTKNIAESRGFGISTSREMLVKGLKGKFFFMSDDTFYIQSQDRQEVIVLPNNITYKGCYVAMRIPILNNEQFKYYDFTEG
ncbi:MAG: hypothetical protein K0B10_13180 [Vicingaceae bacterium]|nr:hypothetical protein [Vicingaceae bacterium]